ESLHEDRLGAIQDSIRNEEKQWRRAMRFALETVDEEMAADYHARAREVAQAIRELLAEHDTLTVMHALRDRRAGGACAALMEQHNDVALYLLGLATEARRSILYNLCVHVRAYRPEFVDPETGAPLRWSLTAKAKKVVARFAELPDYNHQGRQGGHAATGKQNPSKKKKKKKKKRSTSNPDYHQYCTSHLQRTGRDRGSWRPRI